MQKDANSKWSPDFVGIGAERSATTWCNTCLDEHPQICMSHPKELNYFNKNYDRGEEWYRRHFDHNPDALIFGEISPLYMDNPLVAERLARDYPEAKILVILRNPFKRALSHLLAVIRSDRGVVNVNDAALAKQYAALSGDYLRRSLYFQGLKPYFSAFPRKQIIVQYYEDMEIDVRKFLRSLFLQLGVEPEFLPKSAENIINRTSNYQWPLVFWGLRKLARGVKAVPVTNRMLEAFKQRTDFRFQQWIIRIFESKTANINRPKLTFEEVFGGESVAMVKADMELLTQELHLQVPESWRRNA